MTEDDLFVANLMAHNIRESGRIQDSLNEGHAEDWREAAKGSATALAVLRARQHVLKDELDGVELAISALLRTTDRAGFRYQLLTQRELPRYAFSWGNHE